ncbi:uncharacterized protein LOC108198411 [Daucus carota subsp. sativus]|uniref:uncharacterized protein LOC108198411 n=1 Tax=Daucus carota subsp. sativus TaxID=79200 RepID=UPI00308361B6
MEEVPEEGKVYVISEFNVDDVKYSYSAVSNKKEIYFLKRTTMTLIKEDDGMIPKYKFELVGFNALKARVGDTNILTDLMGSVENILPMQSRNTATGPKDILLFDLTDGSERIKVTVWADQAHELKAELDKMGDEYKIIILTSCGITEYRKQLQASSLSPTKFYINPNYDAVHNLRYKLNAINEPMIGDESPSVVDCSETKIETYNLKQITELRKSDMQNLEVICHVSVCSIDAQSKWWFYSCDSCPNELTFIDNSYKCEDCVKIVSYPDKRFKVSMYVTDPTDTIQVFMFDREVRRLVSATVNGLIGQNMKEGKGDKIPEKIINITGKRLILTLSLNPKNLVDGNSVYFASDVVETSENPSPEQPSEQNTTVSTTHHNGAAVDNTMGIKSASNKRVHNKDDGPTKKKKT